jgi:hypothetical protein
MNLEGELAVRRNMNIEGGDGGNEEIAQQIENYKTALTRMRDIVTTANAERQEAQQQLDQCRNDCDRLQLENDRLITECGKSKHYFFLTNHCLDCDELGSLNEQLDAALGSTKMVEYLTEKNLDLEDRIRALTDENDRLDEMIQLSEEIAEAAREGQAELRRECDGYIVELSDVRIRSSLMLFSNLFRNTMNSWRWRIKLFNTKT